MSGLGSAPLPPLAPDDHVLGGGADDAAPRSSTPTTSARYCAALEQRLGGRRELLGRSATSRSDRSIRAPGRPPARPRRPALQGALRGDARRAVRRPGRAWRTRTCGSAPSARPRRRALRRRPPLGGGRSRACGATSRAACAPASSTTPTRFDAADSAAAPAICSGIATIDAVRIQKRLEMHSADRRAETKGVRICLTPLRASPWRSRARRSPSRPARWPSRPPAPSSSRRARRWSSCTATAGNLRDVDFLPLTVDVEERMYAAGKIPGSFFKREGRAGEKGTLTARLIDRPIRPLFPKGWRYETQLVAIPLSVDHVNPYDILAMNGASAALMVSDIPFPTPVGAVRIGKIDGNFVVNPDEEDLLENTDLDLVVAGTEEAILMVEAGANEIPEAEILDALDIAHDEIKKLCAVQRELPKKAGKAKKDVVVPQVDEKLYRADREIARRRARQSDAGRGQARAPGRDEGRRGGGARASTRPTPRDDAETRAGRPARVRQAREDDHPRAHRRQEGAPRRPHGRRDPADLDRGRRRPAHARLGAVHARPDAGVQRRRARHARARRCGSTRSGWRPPSATSTTTTSRRSRSGRPASCAAPSAATSATARSPSARSCR